MSLDDYTRAPKCGRCGKEMSWFGTLTKFVCMNKRCRDSVV